MKYFIDTHDKSKGSFPSIELTEEQFFAQFDALEKAGERPAGARKSTKP
jgi:hypothetical protein